MSFVPICEGTITSKKSGVVTFTLGAIQSIPTGMRFLSFRDCEPIFDTQTGMNLGRDNEILSLLYAKEMNQKVLKANVLKKFTSAKMQAGDKVISK